MKILTERLSTCTLEDYKAAHSMQLSETMQLNIGDIVRQGGRLIEMRSIPRVSRSKLLGTVVDIHENTFPEGPPEADSQKRWAKTIGRRVDIMWANGKLSESFAENSLELVSEI
jgi:hypothetical protein